MWLLLASLLVLASKPLAACFDASMGFPGEGPPGASDLDNAELDPFGVGFEDGAFEDAALEDQREREAEEAFVRACAEEDAAERERSEGLPPPPPPEPGEPVGVRWVSGSDAREQPGSSADYACDRDWNSEARGSKEEAPESKQRRSKAAACTPTEYGPCPTGCGGRKVGAANFFAPAVADEALQSKILEGLPTDTGQTEQVFKLVVETCNANAWAGARARIAALNDEVQAVVIQEHKLGKERIAEADAWLAGAGWWAVWTPARLTTEGRRSGGTAILARRHLGLSVPKWAAAGAHEGHLVAAQLSAPGGLEIGIGSVYLRDSEGWPETNETIWETWAAAAAESGLPCVLGGDWNMAPEDAIDKLQQGGFTPLRGEGTDEPTCVPRGGEAQGS